MEQLKIKLNDRGYNIDDILYNENFDYELTQWTVKITFSPTSSVAVASSRTKHEAKQKAYAVLWHIIKHMDLSHKKPELEPGNKDKSLEEIYQLLHHMDKNTRSKMTGVLTMIHSKHLKWNYFNTKKNFQINSSNF